MHPAKRVQLKDQFRKEERKSKHGGQKGRNLFRTQCMAY